MLSQLTASLDRPVITGPTDLPVVGLTSDSRQVEPNFLFAAIRGSGADGHDYIDQAIQAGASVVVAESAASDSIAPDLAWVQVKDSRRALSQLAAAFYDDPSLDMKVAGVTGTNGKTTTTYLLHFLMRHELLRAGLIGTIKFDNGLEQREATHTTPGPVEIQELLDEMRDNGCRAVSMEVSSHALDQDRTADVAFDVAVFTNFSQDHLDYHGSMEAYFAAKKRLFEQLLAGRDKKGVAVINADDPRGAELLEWCREQGLKTLSYGYGVHVDVRANKLRLGARETSFSLTYKKHQFLVRTPLIGRFNVSNTLAALTAAIALRLPLRECVRALADLPQVPGRLELADTRRGKHVFIDYAHTPDALEKVCSTLKDLEPTRLITVFGCGGDRDKAKRPLMAAAAEQHSDFCIITSDNPRSEDPEAIIAQVAKGMGGKNFAKVTDRAEAIEAAIRFAKPGDIVLVAGKGHEPYQEIDGVRHPFRDHSKIRGIMARVEQEFAEEVAARQEEKDAERKRRRAEEAGADSAPGESPPPDTA